MDRFRVVLVGFGAMGKKHLRALQQSERFGLVAIVDPKEQDVRSAAPGVPWSRSLSDLSPSTFDAALLATPTSTHEVLARQLLRAGKHLLVEKPLTLTHADCQELGVLAEAAGAKLVVAHVERFNPAFRALRAWVQEGGLGTLVHVEATRTSVRRKIEGAASDVILDLAVHDLDLLRLLWGRFDVFSARGRSSAGGQFFDVAELLLAFPQGGHASLAVKSGAPVAHRAMRVRGTLGECFVDFVRGTCVVDGLPYPPPRDPRNGGVLAPARDALQAQLHAFADLLDGQPSDVCDVVAATRALRAVEQAQRLAHSRERPKLHTRSDSASLNKY